MRASGHARRADRRGNRPALFDQSCPLARGRSAGAGAASARGCGCACGADRCRRRRRRPTSSASGRRSAARRTSGLVMIGVVAAHAQAKPRSGDKVPSAVERRKLSGLFTHSSALAFVSLDRNGSFPPFFRIGTPIATICSVHLVPRQRKGRCSGYSGPAPPSLFVCPLLAGLRADQLLQARRSRTSPS